MHFNVQGAFREGGTPVVKYVTFSKDGFGKCVVIMKNKIVGSNRTKPNQQSYNVAITLCASTRLQ